MSFVARVREVNAHRLSYAESVVKPEMTAWRAICARRAYGRWEYLYDDLVVEMNLANYIAVATHRGAERITLHRLGTVKEVIDKESWRPMKGTVRLASEKKVRKIESFGSRNPLTAKRSRKTTEER